MEVLRKESRFHFPNSVTANEFLGAVEAASVGAGSIWAPKHQVGDLVIVRLGILGSLGTGADPGFVGSEGYTIRWPSLRILQ